MARKKSVITEKDKKDYESLKDKIKVIRTAKEKTDEGAGVKEVKEATDASTAEQPKKRGRPKKEIDRDEFERLCAEFCTLEEIAGHFNVHSDTIQRWCRRTYMMTFTEAFNIYSANGKISLRRAQFKAACGGNATLLIWLGKNFLGQSENGLVSRDNEKGMQIMQSLLELKKGTIKKENSDEKDEEEGDNGDTDD